MVTSNEVGSMDVSAAIARKQSTEMRDGISEASLYRLHVNEKLSRFQAILAATGFSEIIISSGESKTQFQDDMSYPFKANPYFKEWTPLNRRIGSFLQITASASKPRLYLLCAEDIWHTARQSLPEGFADALEVVEYETQEQLTGLLNIEKGSDSVALISELNTFDVLADCWNPQSVLNQIDYQRCSKTVYEQHCVREANRLAVPAHRAAYQAFMGGLSELEICAAYYQASETSESEMPYGVIAGLNEHAAVLHHFNLDKQRPKIPRSFLLDAGIDYHGYASDITRTYAFNPTCEFADMIRSMDEKQLQMVAAGAIGKSPVALHEMTLRKIAEILHEFKILTVSVEEALETNMIHHLFLPHGLGHHLGCNVHDKGGNLASAQGDLMPPVEKYPTMRHTAPMVANQVYTVEPGLYFIPSRLESFRQEKSAKYLNWSRIETFIPFGGIRIEDNIILHADGQLENLTRNAFSQ